MRVAAQEYLYSKKYSTGIDLGGGGPAHTPPSPSSGVKKKRWQTCKNEEYCGHKLCISFLMPNSAGHKWSCFLILLAEFTLFVSFRILLYLFLSLFYLFLSFISFYNPFIPCYTLLKISLVIMFLSSINMIGSDSIETSRSNNLQVGATHAIKDPAPIT